MEKNKEKSKMDRRVLLSTLWIFVTVNYIYCDVLSLMEPGFFKLLMAGGQVPGVGQITPVFLLGAAALMEIPFAMIFLSRILGYKSNKIVNIIAGLVMIVVQVSSLFIGTVPTLHYIFYSVIEIIGALLIVLFAWRWHN